MGSRTSGEEEPPKPPRQGQDPFETYEVEVTEPGRKATYPLVNIYTKIREGDREVVQRVAEFPNDDDPEAARQNAAATGRHAGSVGVDQADIDNPGGPIARLFEQRGTAKAHTAQADGARELGRLKATAGDVTATQTEFDLRDGLLAEEETEANGRAQAMRTDAEAKQQERRDKPPLERGLITTEVEVATTGLLGAADIVVLALFMLQRAAVTARVAWAAAILTGLGAAAAGWVVGRGVLGRTTSHKERRQALLALVLLAVAAGVWFVVAMYEMRGGDVERGTAAAITFGAPLCALTVTAAAIVSFVAGAGQIGRDLLDAARGLRDKADGEERKRDELRQQRHTLRSELSGAKGSAEAAQQQLPHVRNAINHAAQSERREGTARWALFATFSRLYRPQQSERETLNLQTLAALHAEGEFRRELARRARLIGLLLAALGGGTCSLVAMLFGAPVELIALAATGGAALGAYLAPRAETDASPSATSHQIIRQYTSERETADSGNHRPVA